MPKKSWLIRVAALLTAPLIVMSASSLASADAEYSGDTWVYDEAPGYLVASMGHIDDGDHFHIWDENADGHGVRGYLWLADPPGQIYTKYNGGGTGSMASFDYDVLSTRTYMMKVCTVDGSSGPNITCSEWRTFTE